MLEWPKFKSVANNKSILEKYVKSVSEGVENNVGKEENGCLAVFPSFLTMSSIIALYFRVVKSQDCLVNSLVAIIRVCRWVAFLLH